MFGVGATSPQLTSKNSSQRYHSYLEIKFPLLICCRAMTSHAAEWLKYEQSVLEVIINDVSVASLLATDDRESLK